MFRVIIISLALLLSGFILPAQQTLEVVTKKVSKQLSFEDINAVSIEGEKAEINVITWDRPAILVEIELIAKHPSKVIAEKELPLMRYHIGKTDRVISIRNFIKVEKDRPEAELTAKITVTVPEECPVNMTNYFGKSHIQNLENNLQVNSQFSPVTLYNVRGEVGVNSKFGNIDGEKLAGQVKIVSHRSNVTLREIEGKYDIHSKYGIIKIFADRKKLNLNVEAEKSDIYFFNPNPTSLGYELTAHYGNITVPNDLKINFIENTDALRHAVFSPSNEKASITLKINFGDIVVKNTKP